jgi:hypothetical protein
MRKGGFDTRKGDRGTKPKKKQSAWSWRSSKRLHVKRRRPGDFGDRRERSGKQLD